MTNPSGASVLTMRQTCRACGGRAMAKFLSLGPQPLANAFLRGPEQFEQEPFFPLDVYFCERCALVQLLDVVDPEVLFRNYLYVTGTSETMAAHNVAYARSVVERIGLGASDLVVEIASNDGSLLKCFKAHGVRTLGIEPAVNIAAIARESGVETVNEFFNLRTAGSIRQTYGPAAVVLGNNVLAHVDDTQDFLAGCKALLGERGVVVVEVPYLRELVDRLEYDTIYHEHLCYFSVSALMRLYESVGLSITRVEHVPVHGGSLRVFGEPCERRASHAESVLELAQTERVAGLTSLDRFQRLAADVERNRRAIRDLLGTLKAEGHTLAGYGAPAKGNTLLNYCGVDAQVLEFTVDRNPMKVGLYTPGTHIPVLPVSNLLERRPDYTLILAWNFADEIVRQQDAYRAGGGRFVVPVPEPAVL